jgi:hypothetical protein
VIGFRVRLSQDKVPVQNFPQGIIIFDDVICNVCDIYSPITGVFTVPKTGIWSLYFT